MAFKWVQTFILVVFTIDMCLGHAYISIPAARNWISRVPASQTVCPYASCGTPQFDDCAQCLSAGGPSLVHATCAYGNPNCQPQFGICGDPYNANPQPHMENGRFSTGLVNGIYQTGQTIYITMVVTAHHKGFHEFLLYDHPDTNTKDSMTTDALPKYLLQVKNPDLTHTKCSYHTGTDPRTQWCMPLLTNDNVYRMEFLLPAGVTCNRCVLQWHWVTGNSPGSNPEEFWNCADITIRDSPPFLNNLSNGTRTPDGGEAQATVTSAAAATIAGGNGATSTATATSTTTGTPVYPTNPPTPPPGTGCVAVPGMGTTDEWCRNVNCDAVYVNEGYCRYATSSSTSSTPSTPSPASTSASAASTSASAASTSASPASTSASSASPATSAAPTPGASTNGGEQQESSGERVSILNAIIMIAIFQLIAYW